MVPVYGNPIMGLGYHRIIIRVAQKADVVFVRIPWRRRDPDLQQKGFRLQYGLKGKGNFIENYIVLTYNNEFCELLFQASHGIGLYASLLSSKEKT